jgi:hypothetical protein
MATTVLYVPEDFDVSTVNDILENKNVQNLHPDALADLWGYLSNITDDMSENLIDISGRKYEVFESLCDKVCKEDTRYKVYGNTKHSPQRIAKKVKREKSSRRINTKNPRSQHSLSGDIPESKVNLNRIKNNQDASTPQYEVREYKESVDVLLFDTGVTITENHLSGKDNFGRIYKIPKSEILREYEYNFSLVDYRNKSENNGITKLSYTIDSHKS